MTNFDLLLEKYVREVAARGRARATLRGEQARLQGFVEHCQSQGLTRLDQVEASHVADFLDRLKDNQTSTVHLKRTTIRRWLRWAHHRHHLARNPLPEGSRAPALPLRWVPTVEEMASVLASTPAQTVEGFCLELLYGTGLRVEECSNLDLTDLDLENRRLRVRRGKNDKPRTLPLGPRLVACCQLYLDKVRPESKDNALLLNGRGRRARPYTVSQWVRLAGVRAQLSKLTVHSIRHAYATHLLLRGAPVHAVKELLGHDSYRSTQLYTRLLPQDVQAEMMQRHPRARRQTPR